METGTDVDRFRVSYDFGEWDVVDEDYFKSLFKETYRTTKKGATLVCFYDIWKLESLKNILKSCGFRMFRFIEWVKTNPVPIKRKVSNSNPNLVRVYDCESKSYKSFKLESVTEFKCNKVVLK